MGRKGNKKRHQSHTNTRKKSESDNRLEEGQCPHVKDAVKYQNLSNTVPHADLSYCQGCENALLHGPDSDDTNIQQSGLKASQNETNVKESLPDSLDETEGKPRLAVDERGSDVVQDDNQETQNGIKDHPEASETTDISQESGNNPNKEPVQCNGDLSPLPSDDTEKESALYVCLRCCYIGCSRQSRHQHALKHYNSKSAHTLAVNLSNWVVWCYQCDDEVGSEINTDLQPCLTLLKKALGVKAAKIEKHKQEKDKKTAKGGQTNTGAIQETTVVMKGLTNLGNTCFFNSVMQNLCQLRLLRLAMDHMLLGEFNYSVQIFHDNGNSDLRTFLITDKHGPLTVSLANFLNDMAGDSKKRVLNPGNLFSEICKKAPRFKGFRQQDSQELLRYLLDSVRTEEIKTVKRGILRSFGVKDNTNKDGVPADQVDSEKQQQIRLYGRWAGAPVIDSLFGGRLVSSVQCLCCNKVSSIMESFLDLSLSLATTNPSLNNKNSTFPKKNEPVTRVSGKNNNKTKQATATTKIGLKPKTDHTPSKHQLKKEANKAKKMKKTRKGNNSGRKVSETEKISEGEEREESVNQEDDNTKRTPQDVGENDQLELGNSHNMNELDKENNDQTAAETQDNKVLLDKENNDQTAAETQDNKVLLDKENNDQTAAETEGNEVLLDSASNERTSSELVNSETDSERKDPPCNENNKEDTVTEVNEHTGSETVKSGIQELSDVDCQSENRGDVNLNDNEEQRDSIPDLDYEEKGVLGGNEVQELCSMFTQACVVGTKDEDEDTERVTANGSDGSKSKTHESSNITSSQDGEVHIDSPPLITVAQGSDSVTFCCDNHSDINKSGSSEPRNGSKGGYLVNSGGAKIIDDIGDQNDNGDIVVGDTMVGDPKSSRTGQNDGDTALPTVGGQSPTGVEVGQNKEDGATGDENDGDTTMLSGGSLDCTEDGENKVGAMGEDDGRNVDEGQIKNGQTSDGQNNTHGTTMASIGDSGCIEAEGGQSKNDQIGKGQDSGDGTSISSTGDSKCTKAGDGQNENDQIDDSKNNGDGTTLPSVGVQDSNSEDDDETPKSDSTQVPEILSWNHSLKSMESIKTDMMSVESCLRTFCTPELLDGDNKFVCEQCNGTRKEEEEHDKNSDGSSSEEDDDADKKSKPSLVYTAAVKQLLIYHPPPVLTLHLKRFQQVMYSLRKVPKHVNFPLVLDIAPFCHKSSKVAADSEGNVLYSLCGVVEHSGSLHSGHYTAFCRLAKPSPNFFPKKFPNLTKFLEAMKNMWTRTQDGVMDHERPCKAKWYYISDTHVSEASEERVLKAQAYILFYERMPLVQHSTLIS